VKQKLGFGLVHEQFAEKGNNMAEPEKNPDHLHTLVRRSLLITAMAGLIGAVFFLTAPATWAAPGQSPEKQTIPTPPPSPPEEPGPTPAPAPLPCGECVRKKIGSEGGEIDLPTNRILVTVPPGSLREEIEFTLCFPCTCECGQCGLVEGALFWPCDVYFTLEGWFVGGQKVPHDYLFASPIGITIGYIDANLAEVGGDPRKLGLAYCDETTGGWIPLASIQDEKNHNVSAPIDHLSWFGLACYLPVIELPQELPETGEENTGWGWPLASLGVLLVSAGGLLSIHARASKV
jgi:hypothetical protein